MTRGPSPFQPGYGALPPVVAGRDELVDAALAAVAAAQGGHPPAAIGLQGRRGLGKTVVLEVVEREATAMGAVVVSMPGPRQVVAQLEARCRSAATELAGRRGRPPRQIDTTTIEATAGLAPSLRVGATTRRAPAVAVGLDAALEDVASRAARADRAVLITLDEAHAVTAQDAPLLAQAFQVAARRSWPVAVVVAGLPHTHDSLTRADSTFFARADWRDVGPLGPRASREALLRPLDERGVTVDDDAAQAMLSEASGHPFVLQAVGDGAWANLGDDGRVTTDVARAAIAHSGRRVSAAWAADFARLSPAEQKYLMTVVALRQQNPDRAIGGGDIAAALGRTTRQLSAYRARTIAKGALEDGPAGLRPPAQSFERWLRTTGPTALRAAGPGAAPPVGRSADHRPDVDR